MNNLTSCWVPEKSRAIIGQQIVREYTYAYSAVCPETGESFSLILPYADTYCMQLFVDALSEEYSKYKIILAMDQASWHTGDKLLKWSNIVPLFIPPRSPELNPVENFWHHIKQNEGFNNHVFTSMEEVTNRLEKALHKMYHNKNKVKSITNYKWLY